MRGAIAPLPKYAFMVWCLVKYRYNFISAYNLSIYLLSFYLTLSQCVAYRLFTIEVYITSLPTQEMYFLFLGINQLQPTSYVTATFPSPALTGPSYLLVGFLSVPYILPLYSYSPSSTQAFNQSI
jgi:hypothetical protein